MKTMKAAKLRLVTLSIALLAVLQTSTSAQVLREIEPALDAVLERQTERVQEQAAERVLEQAGSAQDRIQSGVQENIQENVQDSVQGQVVEQVQNQVEQIQNQIERAQQQAERVTGNLPALDRAVSERVEERLGDSIGGRAGESLRELVESRLPDRLTVTDRGGDPVFVEISIDGNARAIEFEWVMLVDPAQRARLGTEAPELLDYLAETRPFNATGSELLVFKIPPALDADDAILELLPPDLRGLIDRNHVYSAQAEPAPAANTESSLPLALQAVCQDAVTIGMIDSGIHAEHAAFSSLRARGGSLQQQAFLEDSIIQPVGHGTVVASLLIGEGELLNPLLPHASVYSAAVMYTQDAYHQGTTVLHLIEALDWLITEDLQVINMSLAGPQNRLLALAINAALVNGKVIVAAAGNQGPYAEPQYPAAYEGVISATAVASDYSIYRWANQGDYIDYAALGVSVQTARSDGSFGRESGTSIATPVVSAFLACALADGSEPAQALAKLQNYLTDLGEPGRDPVYGLGLLQLTRPGTAAVTAGQARGRL